MILVRGGETMSRPIRKSHNKSILVYHLVCTVKYRRDVLTDEVATTITNVCLDIEDRYEIKFIEIGTDLNHIHYLIQSVPKLSLTQIITTIKSLTAKMVFKMNPEVKQKLWGGEFWSDGYWVVTVSQHSSEDAIRDYVSKQGNGKYELLHKNEQIMSDLLDTD